MSRTTPSRRPGPPASSAVLEFRLALFQEGAHAFLLIAADIAGLARDDKAAELVRRRAATACTPPSVAPVILDA